MRIPSMRLRNARRMPIPREKWGVINDLEIYNRDSPIYNHSLPRVVSVLSITRRKLGLPVISTVDDMKLEF